mgnify:FL=1
MIKAVKGKVSAKHLSEIPFFNFVKLKIKELSGGNQIPGVSIAHVSLPPNYEHVPIFHAKTHEWMFILRGTGKGVVGGKLIRFRPGVMLYMAPGVLHQMSTGNSSLAVLVLFSPPLHVNRKGADICYPAQ